MRHAALTIALAAAMMLPPACARAEPPVPRPGTREWKPVAAAIDAYCRTPANNDEGKACDLLHASLRHKSQLDIHWSNGELSIYVATGALIIPFAVLRRDGERWTVTEMGLIVQ